MADEGLGGLHPEWVGKRSTADAWTTVESEVAFSDPWLTVRTDTCKLPNGETMGFYHVLEYPAWVNIVALTAADQVILVREYRHGAAKVLWGLPSGTALSARETPADAIERELEEETGLTCSTLVMIGQWYANPATHNNQIHSFLGRIQEPRTKQKLESHERIEVAAVPFADLIARLASGVLSLQAYHVASLYQAHAFLMHSKEADFLTIRARLAAATASTDPTGPKSRPPG